MHDCLVLLQKDEEAIRDDELIRTIEDVVLSILFRGAARR
jgi:hypothetical protein